MTKPSNLKLTKSAHLMGPGWKKNITHSKIKYGYLKKKPLKK